MRVEPESDCVDGAAHPGELQWRDLSRHHAEVDNGESTEGRCRFHFGRSQIIQQVRKTIVWVKIWVELSKLVDHTDLTLSGQENPRTLMGEKERFYLVIESECVA